MGKKVLASGTFDLIHYGHLKFLEEAKKAGGEKAKLIVLIARDKTVEKRKGKKPVIPEDQRRALIEALKPVDSAVLGYEELNFKKVLEKIKPDIVAIGYDQEDVYEAVKKIIEEEKLNIKIVKIGRFGAEELNSSSKIKRKVINEWGKP
ncbi:FAD synthase [Candidatus Bathyarchaeota archaeon]|nr:FAD synthase [Candidatus Bathyarchaeota archaeon]